MPPATQSHPRKPRAAWRLDDGDTARRRTLKKATTPTRRKMKQAGERIPMLPAYDATFARLFDAAGIDVLLVGDSVGMVVGGHKSTLPVTMDQMVYHCGA